MTGCSLSSSVAAACQTAMEELSDAVDGWSNDGNTRSGGGAVWPGAPANPAWPGNPSAAPAWPGGQPAGGGVWPGGQPAGGGAWPQPQPSVPGGWTPGPGPGPVLPSPPQQNLSIPFHQELPAGVYDQLLITIAGTIKPDANMITVDLSKSRDVAFHFNPRFDENGRQVIVRNSRISDKWGQEERELQHFPFTRGQPFELKILCTSREFKVAVNNAHLLSYKHRVTDLRSIRGLEIYRDLTLSKVLVETLRP